MTTPAHCHAPGAVPLPAGGTAFAVWAPDRTTVEVVLHKPGRTTHVHALRRASDGLFQGVVPEAAAGDLYQYRLDGQGPYPDPASRFQPQGVHGPSEIIDPTAFAWRHPRPAPPAHAPVIYELHVGTFSPEGTYAGLERRLPHLCDLGVDAIELMPLNDFAGSRNWGYDGVALFAPARCYGRPDDLRRLVDTAHGLGLAVYLDVVYNHLGPDGNYLRRFGARWLSDRHATPWGPALNLDGPQSAPVREFVVRNALHWLHEYRFDGLRLDAVHALGDRGRRPFAAELAERVHAAFPERPPVLIAEDHRNLAAMVTPAAAGGWGLDGVWADDLHHQLRRLLTGENRGDSADFTGSTVDLAETLNRGWFYCGRPSASAGGPRGTDPGRVPYRNFVVCLQNHDQVGNRPLGDRLSDTLSPEQYRAASALLSAVPHSILLFMGQEWASASPFLFFTDHRRNLGVKIAESRRREFARSVGSLGLPHPESLLDPQSEATFVRSRLDWQRISCEPHASTLRLYQALLRLRRSLPPTAVDGRAGFRAAALDEATVMLLRRRIDPVGAVVAVVRLHGAGTADLSDCGLPEGRCWTAVLSTEEPRFAPDAMPVGVDVSGPAPRLRFARPGAVFLRAT